MATPGFLEDYAKDYAAQAKASYSVPIDTSKFTGRGFVAGEDPLQTQAINMAQAGVGGYKDYLTAAQGFQKQAADTIGGLGALSGAGLNLAAAGQAPTTGSVAEFMSPYQQQVIDASLAEFDRNAAIQNQSLRDNAIQMGAYGGGREGVMAAEALKNQGLNRTQLQAQLLAQGFQQAQAAAAADLQARQGLGQYQSALGQQQQAVEQAGFDATQIAAREAEFQPFTQLGLIGQQLAQIQPGAFATQTVGYAPPAAPASPMSQFLGGAAGIAGIGGKLGLFG